MFFGLVSFAARANERELDAFDWMHWEECKTNIHGMNLSLRLCMFRVALWVANASARGGMRFIHTADWQIGKVFKQFGSKEETLRQARLAAIERLGELARSRGASHVLVAGNIYDSEPPNVITLRTPIERMKPFTDICWHLLPGNHDPHGLWDRVAHLDYVRISMST
jgi:hypothetical protein